MVIALVAASIPLGLVATADNGSWSVDCDPGEACFYRSICWTGSVVLASPVRDSNFYNDYFGTGTVLNDHAICGRNNFLTISIRLYTSANYGPSASTCFGPGIAVGPYQNQGQYAGLSSFKGC